MWQLRDEALEKAKAEVREQTALLRVEKLHNKLDEISTDRYVKTFVLKHTLMFHKDFYVLYSNKKSHFFILQI